MGVVLFLTMAGGIGGLLAWALMEPSAPRATAGLTPEWGRWEMMFVLVVGALIGGFLGAASGRLQGSRRHMFRGLIYGVVLGAVGCTMGYQLGGSISRSMFGDILGSAGTPLLKSIPARIIALTPIGMFVGLVLGIPAKSWPRMFQGMIGGAIGAGIGSATFDIVSVTLAPTILTLFGTQSVRVNGQNLVSGETGIVSRALWSSMMGAGIGLCFALVERWARTAWLRLEVGRNEGKEWIIDAAQTFIGRSECADIPLFGDPNIEPMHACITRQGDSYTLVDAGSQIGVGVNGFRVGQHRLAPGDRIQIAGKTLVFLMKSGSSAATSAERARSQMANPIGGMPMGAAPAQPWQQQAQQPTQMAAPMPTSQPTMVVSPPVPTPGATMVATSGPLTGQRFSITGDLEVGREGTGISLAFDTGASRKHASVGVSPSGLQIRDLGSTNGTFVNGQRIQTAILKPGDVVRIGVSEFRVE